MQAVLFDLYETLITHFDPNWVPPAISLAQRLGLEECEYAELWPRFDKAWQIGEVSRYEDALTQLCAAVGKAVDRTLVEQLSSEYSAEVARPFALLEPEIMEVVRVLKQRGLKLGVVTNASDLDAAPWASCPLAAYFDDFIASHDVGLLKPDRRIYEFSCERLGVSADETIFVGDGGANELYGAQQAGLTPYWCTWFLDRWPKGIRPNGFRGDDWRQHSRRFEAPYPYLVRPQELLAIEP